MIACNTVTMFHLDRSANDDHVFYASRSYTQAVPLDQRTLASHTAATTRSYMNWTLRRRNLRMLLLSL
jgi:hypothetical protein